MDRSFVAQLKDYRACLPAAMDSDQRRINDTGTQKDPDRRKAIQAEYADYSKRYNESIDAEQSLAAQINADTKAHCARDTMSRSMRASAL